uniref:Uncharacterized protein n=1 Tax=Timema cristinae TaxID=61476 RepID=A0A7R9DAJ1_TIMCR|nr:unnamed protein product [Timema cristinae]
MLQGLAALKDGRVCGVIVVTDALIDRNSSERAGIFGEIRVTVDFRGMRVGYHGTLQYPASYHDEASNVQQQTHHNKS